MVIKPIKTRVFKEGEDLFSFITTYIKKIPKNSVIIITSKIVALSERRVAIMGDEQAKEKLIHKESDLAIKGKYAWLTVKNGVVLATAGIDESNGDGKFILLPKNSFKVADNLRKRLMERYKIRTLGIIITDSRSIPLRAGALGTAIGYSGIEPIKKYKGEKDIFGRIFKFSRVNVADSLAVAAVLAMGEGSERQPLAIISDAPIKFSSKINRNELQIKIKDDMYLPLLIHLISNSPNSSNK